MRHVILLFMTALDRIPESSTWINVVCLGYTSCGRILWEALVKVSVGPSFNAIQIPNYHLFRLSGRLFICFSFIIYMLFTKTEIFRSKNRFLFFSLYYRIAVHFLRSKYNLCAFGFVIVIFQHLYHSLQIV